MLCSNTQRNNYQIQKLKAIIGVCIVLGIVTGCASAGSQRELPAYKVLIPGSTFRITEDVLIPLKRARVYFQYGNITPRIMVDQYQPNCHLFSYIVADAEQVIHPDVFRVVSVKRETQLVQARSINLASNHLKGLSLFDKEALPMAEIFLSRFSIESSKNPNIKRLECEAWRDINFGQHLSLTEIKQATGKYLVFE